MAMREQGELDEHPAATKSRMRFSGLSNRIV